MQTNSADKNRNVVDVFRDRGFIEQTTHDVELEEYLANDAVCYIGFDPTASSLHVGSLVPIMSLAHMQRHGHRPIALIGGGTGMVGDPSGKTEMRKMLTVQTLQENANGIKIQLSRFLDFSAGKAGMVNNADWLTHLEYIPFLRDIGRHFSVNRMIKAESCRSRMESEDGLSFLEFNYMILQAYDFLELFDRHECRLQMGGSDQWGNIVAGIDLIRRMRQKTGFGITFPLITTSNGEKMGKTAGGAVWLDPEKTSPYEYYQYWINTDDRDVERFLALFTFLPIGEIRETGKLKGADLNAAKTILAFEATRVAHGIENAEKAYQSSIQMFGNRTISKAILPASRFHGSADGLGDYEKTVPCSEIEDNFLRDGIPAFKVFFNAKLASSGTAARKMIDQGGAYINGERIGSDYMVTMDDAVDGQILLRAGKKRYHKLTLRKR